MSAEDKDFRRRSSSAHDNEGDLLGSPSLDELARGLAENSISRRQALRWAGYGVLGAALSSMGFADTAEALTRRQRRRCRRRGGTPLERGACHCGFNCGASNPVFCEGNPDCFCSETIEGRGFCSQLNLACGQTCSSSGQCPSGSRCIVDTCCGVPTCFPGCSVTAAGSSAASGRSGAALNGPSS
jgi:hypothetical protein